MAQTETEWRKEQEEKARQYEEAVPADPDHPAGYTESEMYLKFASILQRIFDCQVQIFHALAGLALLFALQALALAVLIWKAARQ